MYPGKLLFKHARMGQKLFVYHQTARANNNHYKKQQNNSTP